MKHSDEMIKILSRTYAKSTLINSEFKGNAISFKTDEEGNAILLFIGKRTINGTIKGERYSRTLKRDRDGNIFKDHWELKGKAT